MTLNTNLGMFTFTPWSLSSMQLWWIRMQIVRLLRSNKGLAVLVLFLHLLACCSAPPVATVQCLAHVWWFDSTPNRAEKVFSHNANRTKLSHQPNSLALCARRGEREMSFPFPPDISMWSVSGYRVWIMTSIRWNFAFTPGFNKPSCSLIHFAREDLPATPTTRNFRQSGRKRSQVSFVVGCGHAVQMPFAPYDPITMWTWPPPVRLHLHWCSFFQIGYQMQLTYRV